MNPCRPIPLSRRSTERGFRPQSGGVMNPAEIERQLRSESQGAGDGGAELRELLGEPLHQAVIEEPEESQASNNPAPFPEAAWSGLFGQWRDIVAPCTEA